MTRSPFWPEGRPIIVTIDGDGFIYRTLRDGRPVGDLLYETILTRYPFRYCASFIAAEMLDYPRLFDVETALKIASLESVDVASHGWSHPHDWRAPDLDLSREVNDSKRLIEERLTPPGKTVDALLWTGLCNPDERCLRNVAENGLLNLNGGDPAQPWHCEGGFRHYHSRAPDDWTMMDLDRKVFQEYRGPVERFLQTWAGDLGDYRGIIRYFETSADLPVHVYFHWYSGVREDTLQALQRVFEWCLEQDLRPMSLREYISLYETGYGNCELESKPVGTPTR